MEIKNRFTGRVIFTCDADNMRDTVIAARTAGADLRSADLRSADLRSADLRSADLRSANLYGANLRSANLRSANLYGANLYGADLYGADLSNANLYGTNLSDTTIAKNIKLIGTRPVMQISNIGSRNDHLLGFVTDKGLYIKAGCFFGTDKEFAKKVKETHGDTVYGQEYKAALSLLRKHFKLWGAQ